MGRLRADLALSAAVVLVVTLGLVALFEVRGGIGAWWLLSLEPWQAGLVALPLAALLTWLVHRRRR